MGQARGFTDRTGSSAMSTTDSIRVMDTTGRFRNTELSPSTTFMAMKRVMVEVTKARPAMTRAGNVLSPDIAAPATEVIAKRIDRKTDVSVRTESIRTETHTRRVR